MALDTLGVVSNEYRKRLLLRNLVNSDDPDRLFNLGLAMAIPQQYTTDQSDTRQFIASAISIKNFIQNTFLGTTDTDNTTTRAFTQQDYTFNRPYPLGTNDNAPLRDASDQITQNPPPLRDTYYVANWAPPNKPIISNAEGGGQDIPNTQDLKNKTQPSSDVSQFYWKEDDTYQLGNKNLLSFTQSLLKNLKSDSIGKVIDQTTTRFQRPDGKTPDYTKGSNVKDIDDPEKLAREFTVEKPYSTLGDLIRHEKPYMIQANKTSLGVNGFPRIAPTKGDNTLNGGKAPKNLMFSIENLAWEGYQSDLPCLEKGPFGGRLMWFPPYGIAITDNSTANWATTNFVGRGEPIYTYNNAERTMTLQFKVLTDHPSILNAVKKENVPLTVDQFFSATGGKVNRTIRQKMKYKYDKIPYSDVDKAQVHFIKDGKVGLLGMVAMDTNLVTVPPSIQDRTISFSARTSSVSDNLATNPSNINFNPTAYIDNIYEVIDKVQISIHGSSSVNIFPPAHCSGTQDIIPYVAVNRVQDFIGWLKAQLLAKYATETPNVKKLNAINEIKKFSNYPITDTSSETVENCTFEWWQSVNIKVQYDPSKDDTLPGGKKVKSLTPANEIFLSKYRVPLCEDQYFAQMEEDKRFALFSELKNRLNYFHPAFHSMTPEGFNSRLTFLLQCTRQGPSIQKVSGPTNMAFGRPPICILRIGDFYYTKVVIDSVNISYDDSLFDLNPEGIGIQPMLATVDLNMKVIGGSSLTKPIQELQNALSYHFFANAEVYTASKLTTGKIMDDKNAAVIKAREAAKKKEQQKRDDEEKAKQQKEAEEAKQEFINTNKFAVSGVTPTTVGSFIDATNQSFTQTCEEYWLKRRYENVVVNATITFNYPAQVADSKLKISVISNDGVDEIIETVDIGIGDTTYNLNSSISSVRWGVKYFVSAQIVAPEESPPFNSDALSWSPLSTEPRPPCTCVCSNVGLNFADIDELVNYVQVTSIPLATPLCAEGKQIQKWWKSGKFKII